MCQPLRSVAATLLLTAIACGPVSAPPVSESLVDVGHGAIGASGAVVSVDGHATQIGLEVLKAGGNAIDAAIAVGLALAVTYPQAGNLGGGGFMVIYLEDEERYTTLDFREKAPEAATPTMYMGQDNRPIDGLNGRGWLAVGVPGTVAGFAKAHRQWGRLPWSRLVQPAIRLASDGFFVNPGLAASFARVAEVLGQFPGSAGAFLHADGSPYEAGELFVQPDLAWSLRQLAAYGEDAFYRGGIADRLVAGMEATGGLITRADLDSYTAVERPPVRGTYRGDEIISMGPPSSGGTALIEMLNILETFDLSRLDESSSEFLHLQIEAMRQAYLDRAQHLGDADFVTVPIKRLTSKTYAAEVAEVIPRDHARKSADLGGEILVAAESMGNHPLLRGRCRWERGFHNLHDRGWFWRQSGRPRDRFPAQQRNGGFQ